MTLSELASLDPEAESELNQLLARLAYLEELHGSSELILVAMARMAELMREENEK